MTTRPTRADWKRLGTAIAAARMRAEWQDMPDWVDAVGRSPRLLLGLERGESVGKDTLRKIEGLLRWSPGYADRILEDPKADLAPELPRPASEGYERTDEVRPLDTFTTDELLAEVRLRFAELALEVHTPENPTMIAYQDGNDEALDPMSPAQRRSTRGDRE